MLPYSTDDLVLCQRLSVGVGCQAVMPWAAPIGTGRGPSTWALRTLRERLDVPLIVDAAWACPRTPAR